MVLGCSIDRRWRNSLNSTYRIQSKQPVLGQSLSVWALAIVLTPGLFVGLAAGQDTRDTRINPVYLADAPIATETIDRAVALSAQGSFAEAARTLSELILEHGDRLTPDQSIQGVMIPVRRRINAMLMDDPELLKAYQRINNPKARRLLDEGEFIEAAHSYWLTEAGCVGALNYAQVLIESGRISSGLRLLDQLTLHPDASSNAQRAMELSRLVVRAQSSQRAKDNLDRWSSISGLDAGILEPFNGPARSDPPRTSMLSSSIDSGAQTLRLDGIVPRPIASARLTPPSTDEGLLSDVQTTNSGAVIKPKPWSMPVVSGDTLLTNDGVTISSFDRFTLRPRWRLKTTSTESEDQDRTSSGIRSRIARTIEDLSSVTISDGVVYAAAGLARTGGRTGDNRLLALDIDTGVVLHETTLDELDPDLAGATIRGSVIVDNDTLVVAARKNLRRERLVALSLVGIDRRTFERLWIREVGSAGSLPFQQTGQISHSGMLDEGVLYWTDIMGLVCAVETSTGQTLWARAQPSADVYTRYEREPWTISTPVVHGDSVYVLDVSGQMISKLDRETGEVKSSTRAISNGDGLYLLEMGGGLACVGRTVITLHSFDQFAFSKPKLMTPTGDGRSVIQGRVIASGESLIVPIESGLVVLDTTRTGVRQTISLERSGIAVALDGQILIADENHVSSYLSWDIARLILSSRVDELNDIHAAITLSDLAYRSDHHDEILPAIDRAISMLRTTLPGNTTIPGNTAIPGNNNRTIREARDRLFSITLDMVGLPNDRTDRVNPSTDGMDTPRVSQATRSDLLKRAGMIARSPEQTLAHQMTSGAWAVALGEINEAVGIYHGILQDPALSAGLWHGSGLAIRAEIESTHQLNKIVDEYGRGVCEVFDVLARAEIDELNGQDGLIADAQEYEQLARRFPWASTTPSAWEHAASRWSESANAAAAVRAARSGFDAVERLSEHGVATAQATLDSLGSELIGGLLDSQRQSEASRLATKLARTYPTMTITMNGQPIDASTLSVGLSSGLPAPALGKRFVAEQSPTMIAGYPIKSPIRSQFDTVVMFAPQLAQARLVRFENQRPEVLWTRQAESAEAPTVVVHNDFQTVLMWPPSNDDSESGSIESIDTMTGETRWKVDAIGGKLIEQSARRPDDAARIDGQFISPTEGVVRLEQIMTVSDGSVLVLVDRVGRGMGIDLLTGQPLWNEDLPINRVHDLDSSSGVVGITGMWYVDHDADTGVVAERSPRIASIDIRTGQTIQLLDKQTSTPRWIRVAPSGNLIVGTSQRIMSVSTRGGTLDWVIRNDGLINTNAGWIVDDTLIVLDEFVGIWMIGLQDGKLPQVTADTAGRILERGWIDLKLRDERIAVIGSGGLGIYDHDGQTLGLDPDEGSWPYIDAAWGAHTIAMVQRASSEDNLTMHIPVSLLDLTNARLVDSIELTLPAEIQRQPTSAQGANGVVVIGFGEVSVVLKAEE